MDISLTLGVAGEESGIPGGLEDITFPLSLREVAFVAGSVVGPSRSGFVKFTNLSVAGTIIPVRK